MQASKMTVGTVYLVNPSKDWKRLTYSNKAYRLMSLDKMAVNGRWVRGFGSVVIDGVTYSHAGRNYGPGVDGEVKYLALELDPKTGESLGTEHGGKPFLALISARAVRGVWAEAAAEAAAERKAVAEYEDRRRRGSEESLSRAGAVVQRFRALLGIEETYSSKVKVDTFTSSGVTWGSGVTLRSEQAEAVLARLEAAEARVAELAELEQEARHRVAELESILSDNNL